MRDDGFRAGEHGGIHRPMSALTTHSVAATPSATPIPTVHHARAQLAAVEQLLLSVWAATLPEDLETVRSARLCSAHRAVHRAMLLLEEHTDVVADVGPMPAR